MQTRTKRILVLIVGWGFVLLGIAGLFLPILQGVLFILIGLIILSSEYVWAHHLLARLKLRFPGWGARRMRLPPRPRPGWSAYLGNAKRIDAGCARCYPQENES